MERTPISVFFGLALVQFMFSGYHVLSSLAMSSGQLPPFIFATLRISIAAPVLWVVAATVEKRTSVPRRFVARIAICGILGVTGNQVLFVFGLYYTNPVNAALIQPSIAVIAAALAMWVFRQEARSQLKLFGVATTVFGCIVMVLGPAPSGTFAGKRVLLGNLLLYGNCCSFALYLILSKPLLDHIPPYTLTAYTFVYGGIGIVASTVVDLLFFERDTNVVQVLRDVQTIGWIGVLYSGLVATVAAYALNTVCLRRTTATVAAVFVPLQPLASSVLSAIFLGITPTLADYVGGALTVGGLLLVTTDRRRSQAGILAPAPRLGVKYDVLAEGATEETP